MFSDYIQIIAMYLLLILLLSDLSVYNVCYNYNFMQQMSNPYFWPFPPRQQTMYLSTIQSNPSRPSRYSSFQIRDIPGANCKQQIPEIVTKDNFNLSTALQPRPQYWRSIKKKSDPLKHDDIQGSMPQCNQFKTNRVINPLVPKYKLPSSQPVDIPPPSKFMRNTLDIADIVPKKSQHKYIHSPKNQQIQKSSPNKLFRTLQARSRLQVKDINTDGQFISKRRQEPTDPLNPSYNWRDQTYNNMGLSFTKSTLEQQPKQLNQRYGQIQKCKPHSYNKFGNYRKQKSLLNVGDIQGTKANSANQRKYFFERRKDFRDYMNNKDIDKTTASSLHKGITTKRNINPLMPKYNYPA